MKCEEAQMIVSGLRGEGLDPGTMQDAILHVQDCRECAEYTVGDRTLSAALATEVAAPTYLMDRIERRIARAGFESSWMESRRGFPRMKKLVFTAAMLAVLSLLAVGFMASKAIASQPKAKFASMKKAVLAATKKLTDIELKVKNKADGSLGTFVIVDGRLTELKPGVPLQIGTGDDSCSFMCEEGMANMSPEEKQKMSEAMRKALESMSSGSSQGTPPVKILMDGREITADELREFMKGMGIELRITIDLDEAKYQSISFGGDSDTLVLTPKESAAERYVVKVDPKSNLPKQLLLQQQKGNEWQTVRSVAYTLPTK